MGPTVYGPPKINIFANFGSQASDWQFDSQSRYFLAGAQLSVPIFEGLRNRVKISKTRLEIDDVLSQRENLQKNNSIWLQMLPGIT
jgi:outer membrane protein TolC